MTVDDERSLSTRAVILATGSSYRRLDVPALEDLIGAGVFYGGPVSEGHAMSGKEVYIVGGGNAAAQAAVHLARYARRVTLIVRARELRAGMSHYLVREVEATPNLVVRTGTRSSAAEATGDSSTLCCGRATDGDQETVAADGLFVLIGARPHTDWLPDEIARDRQRIPADRRGPHRRSSVPARTAALLARDEYARRFRGG